MAIKRISSEWCGCVGDYKREFIADSLADVKDLPVCCPGSSAIVVAEGKVFFVNASGKWAEFGAEG